jgi:hypothetical protein
MIDIARKLLSITPGSELMGCFGKQFFQGHGMLMELSTYWTGISIRMVIHW